MKAPSHTVAGIDVGGTKKGFHAVALREETVVAKLATSAPGHVVAWCRELGADEVIDHRKPLQEEMRRTGDGEVNYILCCHSLE